ncbi:MAG: phenylalanine--tRNA ligase subunit beta [Alphaproteobacteria bacterium]
MKFTYSWLREHLETTATAQEIAEKLNVIGLEVESLVDNSKYLDGFIVGEVISCEKHPDADRLKLLVVDSGKEKIQIVCGAPNCRLGLKSVLALEGTLIPVYNEKLKKGKIRGVESQGMLCSERELLLSDSHDGIIELPASAVVGEAANKAITFDPIFDVSVTPNRGDCLGVRGIARDLAAAGLGKLRPLNVGDVKGNFASPVGVEIKFESDDSACPLFIGRYIKGVKNVQSPKWLKDRLTAVGLRPISALVDVTNYINYDLCRPLHVFDADKLVGNIQIRYAKKGEKLEALDEQIYNLDESMIAVCDNAEVQSLGGIMGGQATGCTEETENVFLESALFDPIKIAHTGRKLQIVSDSRYRFERWVDPKSTMTGSEYAAKLILDICGGELSEPIIAGSMPDNTKEVFIRPTRIKQLVGIDIAEDDVVSILTTLGFEAKEKGVDKVFFKSPSWRNDIEGEHDLIEEVIRIYGYNKIPFETLPRDSMPKMVLTERQLQSSSIKRRLATRGLCEALTYGFTSSVVAEVFRKPDAKPVMLANPISSELNEMRPNLLPNMLTAVFRNIARGYSDLALFEVGPEFFGDLPGDQRDVAAGVRTGNYNVRSSHEKVRVVDAFDAKADAYDALAALGVSYDNIQTATDAPSYYHPGRAGALKMGKNILAYFGEIHPLVLKKLDIKIPVVAFEVFLDSVPKSRKNKGKAKKNLALSQFQPLKRDFAFVVDEKISASDVILATKSADKQLISDVLLFDVFAGGSLEKGKKSVGIEVTLLPTERTLSESEIEVISSQIIHAVNKKTGGILRK